MEITSITISALRKHTATLIFLHGLGDNGSSWTHLASDLQSNDRLGHVKFVFLNAPVRRITLWSDQDMFIPGWFDIPTWNDISSEKNDEDGILEARDCVLSIINQEVSSGIPASRVILGGFSQGGCIALLVALTGNTTLGGVFGLSTYLPMIEKVKDMVSTMRTLENGKTLKPTIFMGHGNADPKVKWQWGQRSAQAIQEMGWEVEFRTYRVMFHGTREDEIDDLEDFLAGKVPTSQPNLDTDTI